MCIQRRRNEMKTETGCKRCSECSKLRHVRMQRTADFTRWRFRGTRIIHARSEEHLTGRALFSVAGRSLRADDNPTPQKAAFACAPLSYEIGNTHPHPLKMCGVTRVSLDQATANQSSYVRAVCATHPPASGTAINLYMTGQNFWVDKSVSKLSPVRPTNTRASAFNFHPFYELLTSISS
jgi:hypothetical protein